MAGPSRATTLVGDDIYGEINFSITGGTNYFDPAQGHVPAPNSGIQPVAIVTELDGAYMEYEYTNGPAGRVNIDVDVDATSITITETLINEEEEAAFGILGWEIWLLDLDFGGSGGVIPGAIISSTSFTGLSVVASDHGIYLSYAGGQDILTPAGGLAATIEITNVPEPGTAALLAVGLVGIAASRRPRLR